MTATVAKIPDPLTVLTRAERKATGEEPGDLTHLADAVQIQIIAPLTAGGTPVVDDVQVKQLLADKQRLEGVLAESRELAVSRGKLVDRQAKELTALQKQLAEASKAAPAVESDETDRLRQALVLRTGELDQARAARDTAVAQLREQGAAPHGALQLAQEDNVRLADELAAVQEQLSTTRRDLAAANTTLDEIADEQASRPVAVHRHQFELDVRTGEHKPCECKQPWIRDLVEDCDEVAPDVEPLDALFARIRSEVGEVTQ